MGVWKAHRLFARKGFLYTTTILKLIRDEFEPYETLRNIYITTVRVRTLTQVEEQTYKQKTMQTMSTVQKKTGIDVVDSFE